MGGSGSEQALPGEPSRPDWLVLELSPWLRLLCNCFPQLTDSVYFPCSAPSINLWAAGPSEEPSALDGGLTVHHFNLYPLEALKYMYINTLIYIVYTYI